MSKLENLLERLRASPASQDRNLAEMFPAEKIEAIKRRERRRFHASQDRKWANWLASMSK